MGCGKSRTRKVRRNVVEFRAPFLRKGRLNMLRVPWRRPRERARWLPILSSCCYPASSERGFKRDRECIRPAFSLQTRQTRRSRSEARRKRDVWQPVFENIDMSSFSHKLVTNKESKYKL